jgi:ribosomal protein L13E
MTLIKPIIFKKGGKKRCGKGFSREAVKLSIPIDSRRKTIHEENVNTIKRFLKSKNKASKPKKRRKSKS